MKNWKEFLTMLLVFTMLISMLPSNIVLAATDNMVSTYEGDGYQVTFTVENQWDSGFQATVKLKNTSSDKIENWSLGIELPGKIQNIWNAKISSQEEDVYMIKNVGWNQDIETGESRSFGFICDGAFEDFPEEYMIQSQRVVADTECYKIEYTVSSDWENGFNGNLEIKNISEECIEDWELEMDFDNEITNIWNAEILDHTGNHYVIGNPEYNQNIQANASINIGFTCQKGNSLNMPENYLLHSCEFEDNDEDEYDDDAEDDEDDGEPDVMPENAGDYVYIDFHPGNTYKSVIDDVTFVNAAEDRMQVTWEISNENIINRKGKVSRQNQDEKVIVTAHILIDGQEVSKKFELVVMGKLNVDKSSLKDYSVDELKEKNREDEYYSCEVNDFGYLQTIYGNYSDIKVTSYEAALYSLYNIKSALGISNPLEELQVYDIFTSEYGYTFHFQQVYQGIAVFSNEITVYADENGNTSYIRSSYYPFPEQVETIPKHSYEFIKSQFQTAYPDCEVTDEDDNLYLINYYGHVDLVWNMAAYFPEDNGEIKRGENQLLLGATDAEVKYHVVISSGNAQTRNYTVKGKDLLGKQRKFRIQRKKIKVSNSLIKKRRYCLYDNKRKIEIYNGEVTFFPNDETLTLVKKGKEPYYIYNRKKKTGWSKECVSAMANLEDIYDYVANTFGYYSYSCATDKQKARKMKVYTNTDLEDNLQWNHKYRVLTVGMGTGYSNKNWENNLDDYHFADVALEKADDLLCHEFAHGIFFHSNNLKRIRNYEMIGVYGIVNEAYADLLACCYDHNWTIGEKAAQNKKVPARNICNPVGSNCAVKLSKKDPFYVDYMNYSNDNGGVHQNSTILTHIFYELSERSDLTWHDLELIWNYSVNHIGYDNNCDFGDIVQNLQQSLKGLKLEKYASMLNTLFTEAGINEFLYNRNYTNYRKARDKNFYCSSYFCDTITLQGKVLSADYNTDLSDNMTLDGVKISGADGNMQANDTNSEGEYVIKADIADKYCIQLKREGYLDELMYVADINEILQSEYYCDTVELIAEKDGGTGNAYGQIRDAANVSAVKDLHILVRKGINNIYSEPLLDMRTNKLGEYQLQGMEAGNYCLEVLPSSESNYIGTYFNIKILGGRSIGNQDGIVSSVMDRNRMRIVLTWGQKPRDLDAHLQCNVAGENSHIYYQNKSFCYKDVLFSTLDIDDVNGYGPETITFRNDITGDYQFYVHNYSAESELAGCGAMVRVYLDGMASPAYTFHVPAGDGNYWTVFTYNTSTHRLQPINEIR